MVHHRLSEAVKRSATSASSLLTPTTHNNSSSACSIPFIFLTPGLIPWFPCSLLLAPLTRKGSLFPLRRSSIKLGGHPPVDDLRINNQKNNIYQELLFFFSFFLFPFFFLSIPPFLVYRVQLSGPVPLKIEKKYIKIIKSAWGENKKVLVLPSWHGSATTNHHHLFGVSLCIHLSTMSEVSSTRLYLGNLPRNGMLVSIYPSCA